MSLTIDGKVVDVDSKVSFSTYNTFDTRQIWSGYVEAICNKSMASRLTDIDGYQNQILKSINTSSPPNSEILDIKNSDFIIIRTADDGEVSKIVAFAIPWISSLNVLDVTMAVDFRVYNLVEADKARIIQILADSGFKAKISPK